MLAALGLLTSLYPGFSTTAANHARMIGHVVLQREAKLVTASALEVVVAALHAPGLGREALLSVVPVDGSVRVCRLTGAVVAVRVQDLAGRVDLNEGRPALVRALARAVLPGGAGEAAAEAILRHRAAARAAGRLPFRTTKDLARVAGPAAALAPHVTVWSLEDGIAPGAVDPALRPLLAEEAGRPGAGRGLGWRRYAVELDVTTGRGATAGFAASMVLEPGGAAPWRLLQADWRPVEGAGARGRAAVGAC
ncbi:hypothetical protein SH611_16145 [Geminicoccaceae bacterium 1502E]|nr:hypothetical protein [Geminicoccaceae bacterium 1502E]